MFHLQLLLVGCRPTHPRAFHFGPLIDPEVLTQLPRSQKDVEVAAANLIFHQKGLNKAANLGMEAIELEN